MSIIGYGTTDFECGREVNHRPQKVRFRGERESGMTING